MRRIHNYLIEHYIFWPDAILGTAYRQGDDLSIENHHQKTRLFPPCTDHNNKPDRKRHPR